MKLQIKQPVCVWTSWPVNSSKMAATSGKEGKYCKKKSGTTYLYWIKLLKTCMKKDKSLIITFTQVKCLCIYILYYNSNW
jgi:hypothetical protein